MMEETPKPKNTGGRRTKLTPEASALLIDSIRLGCTDKAACQRAGIDQNTLLSWRERGEAGEQPFADFWEAYTRAKGDRVAMLAGHIVTASKEDWRAGAWYLEHAESDEFSPKTKTEVTGAGGGPLNVNLTTEPDQAAAVLSILASAGGLTPGTDEAADAEADEVLPPPADA